MDELYSGEVLQHPLPLLNTKTHRKLLRHMEIIILGAIGNTPRQNRDNMRVLDRGGQMFALKAHIDKDKPLVVRKWKTKR